MLMFLDFKSVMTKSPNASVLIAVHFEKKKSNQAKDTNFHKNKYKFESTEPLAKQEMAVSQLIDNFLTEQTSQNNDFNVKGSRGLVNGIIEVEFCQKISVLFLKVYNKMLLLLKAYLL